MPPSARRAWPTPTAATPPCRGSTRPPERRSSGVSRTTRGRPRPRCRIRIGKPRPLPRRPKAGRASYSPRPRPSWKPAGGSCKRSTSRPWPCCSGGGNGGSSSSRSSAVSLLEQNPMHRFAHALELARAQYHALAGQIAPRFFQGLRPLGILLLLAGLATLPAGAALGWRNYRYWVPASAGGSLAVFAIVGGLAVRPGPAALRRALPARCGGRCWRPGWTAPPTLEAAKIDCQRLYAAVDSRYDSEAKRADDAFTAAMAEHPAAPRPGAGRDRDEVPAAAGRDRGRPGAGPGRRSKRSIRRLLREIGCPLCGRVRRSWPRCHAHAIEASPPGARSAMGRDGRTAGGRASSASRTALDEIRQTCERLFPDWHGSDWDRWTPPRETPAGGVRGADGGPSSTGFPAAFRHDPRLRPPESGRSILPALAAAAARTRCCMLKAADEGRATCGPAPCRPSCCGC